jgi:subfamily B ATP-binding cassette protein MsbA
MGALGHIGKDKARNMKWYLNLIRLRIFLNKIDTKFTFLLIPMSLSLLAAFFEGVSATLLIPLAKGVIGMDFAFVKEAKLFQNLLSMAPSLFNISNTALFILLVAMVFATVLFKNIFLYFSSLSVAYQVKKLSHNLRKLIFGRYLSFGKLFFDRTSQGYLHNLITGYTKIVAYETVELAKVINNIFMFFVYIIIMFTISVKLTIIIAFISPVFYYSVSWLFEKIKETSHFYAKAQNNLSKQIFDLLSCIPLVKVYAREEEEKEKFSGVSETVANLEFSMTKKHSLINPLQETILLIVVLSLISVVAFMVVKQKREVAGFLVYFYVMRRAVASFGVLNNFIGKISTIRGPLSEIFKILEDKDKFFVVGGQKEFKGLEKSIDFKNLNFSYIEGVPVLKDLTLSIEKGRITALVGPTGSGKTTMINLILHFYECPPASIFIDGIDVREFNLKSLLAHTALVSQETLLFNDTLKNNIIYGLDRQVSDEELIEVIKKARLYDFVMNLPSTFNTLIGDRGTRLSGGEKQRVSIARALLKNSEILIMDEATSSLDTKTETLIQEAINELVKEKTVIVIAHRLSTIKNADKIIVVEDGRVIEEGSLTGLLDKKGKFYGYWEEQKFY